MWAKKSANNGDATGQFILGNIYHQGRIVPRNYKKAVQWYRKAAKKGYTLAQYYLGIMLSTGYGTSKNKDKATSLWKEAALKGHVDSMAILSAAYLSQRKLVESYAWASIGQTKGNGDCKKFLNELNGLMSNSEIEEAQEKAAAFWERIKPTKAEDSLPLNIF
jgi:TPR repeat protein